MVIICVGCRDYSLCTLFFWLLPQPLDTPERILILLLRNDGRTQQEIADLIGCSLRKVAY